jgi:hypothetical protein
VRGATDGLGGDESPPLSRSLGGPPLVNPPPEGEERSLALWTVGVFLAVILSVAGVNLLVDPYGAFGTGLLPPITWQDREEKARLFEKEPSRELLILGSSRVMKLDPLEARGLTGLTAFNFGVMAARPEDYLAVMRFAVANGGSPRRIILGVDPEALAPNAPFDPRSQASRALAPHSPRGQRLQVLTGSLIGWESLRASLHSLRTPPSRRKRTSSYRGDGLLRYVVWDSLLKRNAFDGTEPRRNAIAVYRSRYAGFDSLSTRRIGYLTELLEEARSRGIRVDAFVPPLAPSFMDSLSSSTLRERVDDTRRLLSDLDRKGLLHAHDLFDVSQFGGDTAGFYDGTHVTPANASLLLRAILTARRDAVQ